MAMSLSSVGAVTDSDGHVTHGTSAKNPRGQRLADVFGLQVSLDILGTRNGLSRQRHQDVTDDDSGFVGRSIGFDFENNGSGLFFVWQRLAQMFIATHGLQSHAEIPAWDAAFFQQCFGDAVDSGGGDGDGAESRKARRCDSQDFALRVDYGAPNSPGLPANIATEVWGQAGRRPGTAFLHNQA